MSTDYASVVQAGINFLDKQGLGDWRSKIDKNRLDLEDCDVCVLGQVFGTYDYGLGELAISRSAAKKYGFNTDYDFGALTQAWKDALGKDNVLVEKGDVYHDKYGCCAVRIVGTHSVAVSDTETEMVYLGLVGSVAGGVFKPVGDNSVSAHRRNDFGKDGYYKQKLEEFSFKAGMFVTNDTGEVWYLESETIARPVKDQAQSIWSPTIDTKGLREVRTAGGKKFADTVK